MSASDWSFVRRRRWLASHLLVAMLAVVMVGAGLWQLDRHRERADRNDLIAVRSELSAVDVAQLFSPGVDASVGHREQFRPVIATGVYAVDDEVLVRNRTLDGSPGWWVLTPLVTDRGWAVIVNRGWIPLSFVADETRPAPEPSPGVVTVHGWIQPTRTAEGFQRADPAEGRLSSLGRPDMARLASQLDYPISPVVLQLMSVDKDGGAEGAGTGLPVALDLPRLDGGPHLSYAVQWFVFGTTAVVGYPLILRKVSRERPHVDERRDAGR